MDDRQDVTGYLWNTACAFKQAFPGGLECPPWASIEIRIENRGGDRPVALVRFYTHANGKVYTSESIASNASRPEQMRSIVEITLERLRRSLDEDGIPVPHRVVHQ